MKQIPASKNDHLDHARPASPKKLPPVHRWIAAFGLLLFAAWFMSYFVIAFVEPFAPVFGRAIAEPARIFFVISLSFLTFGLCCEVVYNLVIWHHIRKNENSRLTDLCGRTRFDRSRKKHKLVRLELE